MERLTKRELADNKGKLIVLCDHKEEECNDSCMYRRCEWNEKALKKLKEYEDIEEQITKKFADCIDIKTILDSFCAFYDMQETNEELAQCTLLTNEDVLKYRQLKAAEEQGLLLRLPCKVGDTLWWTNAYGDLCSSEVNSMFIEKGIDGIVIETFICNIAGKEIGKTVFFTKEEAEQALARMENNNGEYEDSSEKHK